MTQPLPEFENPPVTEVALSVQFDKLEQIGTPQLGCIWQEFRDRFPKTEEHPPLEPAFEQFGPKVIGPHGVRLRLVSTPPCLRLWFLNESGSELVQVQHDRFVRNWRRNEEAAEYPRYSRLRDRFRTDFEAFCRLVEEQKWGSVAANQCEVTYLNIIPAGEGWEDRGDLGRVLTVFSARYTDERLAKPEEATVDLQFVMSDEAGEPVGRLHISASPMLLVSDSRPAIRLTLTARGGPPGSGAEEVMAFFDRGHEAIVRGFASITTPEMHKVWKRIS
jgi:uncharacterized protein (TIGR04255 family)